MNSCLQVIFCQNAVLKVGWQGNIHNAFVDAAEWTKSKCIQRSAGHFLRVGVKRESTCQYRGERLDIFAFGDHESVVHIYVRQVTVSH